MFSSESPGCPEVITDKVHKNDKTFQIYLAKPHCLFMKELLFLTFHNLVIFSLEGTLSISNFNIFVQKEIAFTPLCFLLDKSTGQIIRGQICLELGLYNDCHKLGQP